jgi:hypothetical protein
VQYVRPARLAGLAAAIALLSFALAGRAEPFGRGLQPSLAPWLADADASPGSASEPLRRGSFTALTYNVAGIPQLFSGRTPRRNNPLVGPLLDRYDLVLVQEDFMYHRALEAGVTLAYRSPPHPVSPSLVTLGDGLSQFARFPMEAFERVRWRVCSGLLSGASDCAARKGYTYFRLVLDEGVDIDVYNLHLDAGWGRGDWDARGQQVTQLITEVGRRSAGRPVIIGGDTNLRWTGTDPESLERLVVELELTDACHALNCRRERVDRLLFRGSAELELSARAYFIPDEFVDARGNALSDHHPVAVTFAWEHTSLRVASGH